MTDIYPTIKFFIDGEWTTGDPGTRFFDVVNPSDETILGRAPAANAATLAWRGDTLPYFSLWKNQAGLADGYVTGFEPGTNFPNPRSFEESQGRVVPLAAHASVQFDLAIEHHAGSGVESARLQLLSLGANNLPRIHDQPRADWSR